MRNPTGYTKLGNGEWDFDILMDMLFSFWVLRPIPDGHPRRGALLEAGTAYTCTCPKFLHYHSCKHTVAFGLHNKCVKVPLRYDTTTVGKRKAPAGASLTKRGRCMAIDD